MAFFKNIFLLILLTLLSSCGSSGDSTEQEETSFSPPSPQLVIDSDQDGFAEEVDCDDNNDLVHALKTFYVDKDVDGFGSLQEVEACALINELGQSRTNNDPDDNNFTITPFDQDGDGTLSADDCNDYDDSIALVVDYYMDIDNDGYGAGAALSVCTNQAPDGYALSNADPDDKNASIIPDDYDGDGVANANDCEPDDGSKYINQIYYADIDGDNLGSGFPVNICVSLPIPALDTYSLVAGDSCPDDINSNKDFDEDSIDDICDQEIRVLSDKIISGDEYISLRGKQDGSKTFFFGANGNPVVVTIEEDASLSLSGGDTTLYLEGGSKLVVNKTAYDKTPSLIIRESTAWYGAAGIVGIGDNNKIEFYGARVFLGSGNIFDNIEQIYVTTKELYNPITKQDKKYRTKFYYSFEDINSAYLNSVNYPVDASTAPTIQNSPGHSALYVYNQTLEVGALRFLNNKVYPIQCVGDDTYKEEWESYLSFSACQFATYSRYQGNLFNGPLLNVSYTDNANYLHFRYEKEMSSLNIGTNNLYIQHFSVQSTGDVDGYATFQYLTLNAAHNIIKDISGDIIDLGLFTQSNSIPYFRVYNPGFTIKSFISFYDTDLREVPIIIEGGSVRANASQVGVVLFPNLGGSSFTSGSFVAGDNTTLDFASSPYVVSDGTYSYGMGLPNNFAGYVQLGSDIGGNPVTTEDTIISDSSLRHPIIDTMPMTVQTPNDSDLITASQFRLTKSVDLIGTDVGSVFGQDSSVNSLFLRKK